MQFFFTAVLKMLPFQLFGYKKLIYHPNNLENVLYKRYALVQEKTCVKHLKKKWWHKPWKPIFGQCNGETWKPQKLYKVWFFFLIGPVLVYLHRNNKYTMTKTNQKIMEDQVSFFSTRIGPLPFLPETLRVLQININIKYYWIPLFHFNFKPLSNKHAHKMLLPLKTNKKVPVDLVVHPVSFQAEEADTSNRFSYFWPKNK